MLAELRSSYERHSLTSVGPADFDRWCAITGWGRREMLDGIAARLAIGFDRGSLTWEFCDYVVNALVWHLYRKVDQAEWAELFWRTYLAFDDGEYTRPGKPLEDPIEIYTRPEVCQIVEEYNLADDA